MQVLVLSGNTGEGHNSAARALKEYFESCGDVCHVEDGLAYMGRSSNAIICKGHVFLYRKLPKVFGMGYRFEEQQYRRQHYQKKLVKKVYRQRKRNLPRKRRDLRELLCSGAYDAVICTHMFTAQLVSELRCSGQAILPSFFVSTDYTCSPGANQLDVDAWLIPHPGLIPEYTGYGIPEDKLIPTGIPVRGAFMEAKDKATARQELGLPADRPIAVLSCGSMGAGPMGRMVLSIVEALPENGLLVAICGNNHSLKRNLEMLIHSDKLQVVGYTQRMQDYMSAADLFLTKPGGLSTTEAAMKRVPMLLFNAVPGCETHNLEFLQGIGCALTASSVQALAQRVVSTLSFQSERDRLRANCAREFSWNAAERIYEVVKEACQGGVASLDSPPEGKG